MNSPNPKNWSGPRKVSIYEVGPRDGLQNEATVLPLETKLEMVRGLVRAHPSGIELTSFVRPDWIPPLADADELCTAVRLEWPVGSAPVPFSGLVPNMRGYARFRAAGLDQVAIFLSASEAHNKANINRTVDQSLELYREVIDAAKADALPVRAYISTSFGCPYEGPVDPERVLEIVRAFAEQAVDVIVLSDTVGVAQPEQVRALCRAALEIVPAERLAMHMHDTYGMALANVLSGWQCGLHQFDAALGGTGGCPYAPGASGNLATEDLVWLFESMGVEHGVDLQALVETGIFLERALGRTLPGRALRALSAKKDAEACSSSS